MEIKQLRINKKLVETTITKLEDMYKTEKGKIFVLHLIRSFVPLNELSISTKVPKGAKCCLTGVYLKNFDKLDSQSIKVPEFKLKFDESKVVDKFIEKVNKLKASIPETITNPRVVLYSDSSDKLLTIEASIALTIYVMQEVLNDNREINYVINQQLYGKKKKKSTNRNIVTLGDIVDLSALKSKMTK